MPEVKLGVEEEELPENEAEVDELLVDVVVSVSVLQVADDHHQEAVGTKSTVPRRVQAIDLQQLLEHEHQRLENVALFQVYVDNLNDLVASVLLLHVAGVLAVDHMRYVHLEFLLVDVPVLRTDRNALLLCQRHERAREVDDGPFGIDVHDLLQPLSVLVLLRLERLLDQGEWRLKWKSIHVVEVVKSLNI